MEVKFHVVLVKSLKHTQFSFGFKYIFRCKDLRVHNQMYGQNITAYISCKSHECIYLKFKIKPHLTLRNTLASAIFESIWPQLFDCTRLYLTHKGLQKVNIKTIVLLGQHLDVIYPRRNHVKAKQAMYFVSAQKLILKLLDFAN